MACPARSNFLFPARPVVGSERGLQVLSMSRHDAAGLHVYDLEATNRRITPVEPHTPKMAGWSGNKVCLPVDSPGARLKTLNITPRP